MGADAICVGGGWTPSVVPEVEGLLETTAGSVCTIQLPTDRHDLWEKVWRSCSNVPFSSQELTIHRSSLLKGSQFGHMV